MRSEHLREQKAVGCDASSRHLTRRLSSSRSTHFILNVFVNQHKHKEKSKLQAQSTLFREGSIVPKHLVIYAEARHSVLTLHRRPLKPKHSFRSSLFLLRVIIFHQRRFYSSPLSSVLPSFCFTGLYASTGRTISFLLSFDRGGKYGLSSTSHIQPLLSPYSPRSTAS